MLQLPRPWERWLSQLFEMLSMYEGCRFLTFHNKKDFPVRFPGFVGPAEIWFIFARTILGLYCCCKCATLHLAPPLPLEWPPHCLLSANQCQCLAGQIRGQCQCLSKMECLRLKCKRRMCCASTFQLTEISRRPITASQVIFWGMKAFQGGIWIFWAINTRFLVALSAADAATTVPHFPKTVSKIYHHSAIAR